MQIDFCFFTFSEIFALIIDLNNYGDNRNLLFDYLNINIG